ncbi:MAG: cobalt transporter CbiM [Candidatus Thermoplasmatota archaeon]|nr:cobalt transporter CbiM [Candidatus Thermoplasmatota archaeon]
MVHIADGILAPEVWIAGFVITGIILAYTLYRTKAEEIPKISLVTSAVFVASLIHIPLGPTSVHLILAGLAGVLLAEKAYPSVFIALLLQAFLFQHGGITTIGINTVIIGVPALVSYGIFVVGVNHTRFEQRLVIFGGLAGGVAIVLAVVLTSIALLFGGEEFLGVVALLAVAHVPVIVIEAVIVGSVVGFLNKVKPEMLARVRE